VFGFGGREKVKPFLLSISLPHIGATFQPSAVREEQQDEVVTIKVRKAPIKKKKHRREPWTRLFLLSFDSVSLSSLHFLFYVIYSST
jgi:hypothetical protein